MALIRRRVSARGGGRYRVRLPAPERDLLVQLAGELRTMLSSGPGDPSLRRVFPVAYNEDPEREREYQALVRDELLERHLAAIDELEAALRQGEVGEDVLMGWMRCINDLRLVIGTRLDLGEELPELGPDHPDAPALAVYEYLGHLLHETVDALASSLRAPSGRREPGDES